MLRLNFLFFIVVTALFASRADASSDDQRCPVVSEHFNPDIIQLRSGVVRLNEYEARIELPPNIRFIEAADARAYRHHVEKGSICDTATLAGFFVSGENWRNFPAADIDQGWMIELHYRPTFASPSDMITTDYDEIVQQVRESYYDREEANFMPDGRGIYRHVMGWAISPEFDKANDAAIWSLNIAEGNQPTYTVPLHGLKMGRVGHFRLFGYGTISQTEANAELLRQLSGSIRFDRGWALIDSRTNPTDGEATTIGQIIAYSVNAQRATPLTWGDYFGVLINGLLKFGYFYLVEILAFATMAILWLIGVFLRNRWMPTPPDDGDWEGEDEEDWGAPARPVVTLNGRPLDI